jgi:hypothetical protein
MRDAWPIGVVAALRVSRIQLPGEGKAEGWHEGEPPGARGAGRLCPTVQRSVPYGRVVTRVYEPLPLYE